MRRWIAAFVLAVTLLCSASPADAFWHRGWGWGHRWGGWGGGYGGIGYRGFGWGYPYYGYRRGGFGYPYYGGFGYGYPYGVGYGGYGGGYGGYGGYYPSYYGGYSPWYGCYNYGGYGTGATVGLGYPSYGLYSAYRPMTNIIVTTAPASAITSPAPTVARPRTSIIAAAPTRPATVLASIKTAPVTAIALQKFLGLKDVRPMAFGDAPTAVASAPTTVAPGPAPLRNLGDVLARVSNVEYRRKAERMITEGDELFRAQNFHSALQKYKLAASTAPDLAEAFWRQGHALVATHNYELATTAFKRAIALTDDLGRGGFRLNDIYAGAAMTKNAHLESLAEWAINRRNSSDPYFLLGLFLEYDGQPARAGKFFQKASDLAGISGGHIAVFLDPAMPAPEPRVDRVSGPAPAVPLIPVSTGTDI